MLKFGTRTCPACGQKEFVQPGSDCGPVIVPGQYRCNETAWIIRSETIADIVLAPFSMARRVG